MLCEPRKTQALPFLEEVSTVITVKVFCLGPLGLLVLACLTSGAGHVRWAVRKSYLQTAPRPACFLLHVPLLIHFPPLMYCCGASSPIRACNVHRFPSA